MDGNVIKVIKSIRGCDFLSTSQHDLICTVDYSSEADAARVIDPGTGKVLAAMGNVFPYHRTVFGFCRDVSSSVYKLVRVRSATCSH
jgi:hypothetical protein